MPHRGEARTVELYVRTVTMTPCAKRALVTVRELAERLSADRPPVVIDVRWTVGSPPLHNDYLAAHIPGAHWCDLDADLADPPGRSGGRHPLPDPRRLQERIQSWGIDADSAVVVYDGAESVAASRAWWVLRWAGLNDVGVLDGGFRGWVAADEPVHTGPVPERRGTFVVHPGHLPTLDAASAADWSAAGRLVDARAAERFRGEVEPIDPVAGRIPGAVNLPTTGNVTSAGEFLPAAVLRRRFTADGLGADGQPVGVYCGSGVTAAHTVLAMHLAGLDAVLYPGSWSDWISDPERPVATG
jgi:thiosulfate/3-mercaptopyruvate sulfurtransferase